MKKLWIDTETSGTDHKKCAIVEIGAVVEIDGVAVDETQFLIKPFDGAMISAEAMKKNNISLNQVEKEGINYFNAHVKLTSFMDRHVDKYDRNDKFVMCGYNVGFDSDFIHQLFLRNNDDYIGSYRWWDLYDVRSTAIDKLGDVRHEMENFQLETLAKYLGLEVLNAHRALDDIKLTIDVDNVLKGMI